MAVIKPVHKSVSNPSEAIEYIRAHITSLENKLNQEIATPLKYESYSTKDHDILSYAMEYINNSGKYNNSYYYKPNDVKTIEAAQERAAKLNELLDAIEKKFDEVRARNVQAIEHNREIRAKVGTMMQLLGIADSRSVVDSKSRARNKPMISQRAGYLTDLDHYIPLVDGSSAAYHAIKTRRETIKRWVEQKTAEIRKAEDEKKADVKQKESLKFLARLAERYECEIDEDDILETILERSKYLALGHAMLRTRNDYSNGIDSIKYAVGAFSGSPGTTDDAIYHSVTSACRRWDGDGRTFRDCEWDMYAVMSEEPDQQLYQDYMSLTEKYDHLTM